MLKNVIKNKIHTYEILELCVFSTQETIVLEILLKPIMRTEGKLISFKLATTFPLIFLCNRKVFFKKITILHNIVKIYLFVCYFYSYIECGCKVISVQFFVRLNKY